MEILDIKQKLDSNDLKTARTENERDKEYLEETEFNETREDIYEEDEGFWDFLAYKTWLEILINDEQVHNPGSELLEPVAMAELTKEVLGLQSEYNQKLEEDKKKDHMAMFQTLAAATEANSEHTWHCYEKHNAETSGFVNLLQYYEQRCRKLEKENSDLLAASKHDQGVLYNYERHCHRWKEEKQDLMAKLNAADSAAEHDQGVLYNYERHFRRWEEEKQDLMAKLNAADSTSEHDQGVLYNYEQHCRRWEEEKQDLMAKLNAADSTSEHDQGVLYNYEQHCRRWEEEKQDLMAKLHAAYSASEHDQVVLYDYERQCRNWEEEKADLNAKLTALTSVYQVCFEGAHAYDQGMWDKERNMLKAQNAELAAKLNGATSSI
jgi:chromosome segregation ATPase